MGHIVGLSHFKGGKKFGSNGKALVKKGVSELKCWEVGSLWRFLKVAFHVKW